MAHRLHLLAETVKKEPKIVDSSFDFLNLASFLTPEENVPRPRCRTSGRQSGSSWTPK